MKRKILVIILAMVMVLGLAACGGGSGGSSSGGSADATDWAYIEGKGEMIIGITYFEPMNYLDDQGNLTGFETEFAEAVCEILGVKPVFQEISWSAKETELSARNIDCIWNGMTINEERLANMSISQPYMENRQVLIVKAERADELGASVEGKSIVAEKGSAGETVCMEEEFFANANYTAVDTQAKGLLEVSSGTADGCVVDYVVSIGMIGPGTDNEGLVTLDQHSFGQEEYGVALRKADTEFTGKLNDAINQVRSSGKLKEIGTKYKLDQLLVG